MDAAQISHIGICVRDMEKPLAFYRDALGMEVVADGDTDPTEGGRPHNYRHPRRTRRRVSLSFSQNPTNPTLTLTNHPGEEPDGQAIQLDQVGISHLAFSVADPKSLAEDLISKDMSWPVPGRPSPTARGRFVAFTCMIQTVSWSSSPAARGPKQPALPESGNSRG